MGQPVVLALGQAEVGDPDDARAWSSSRFDGLMSRWTMPRAVGVGQPLRRLAADLRHAPEERRPRPERWIVERAERAARAARPRPGDRAESGRAIRSSARPMMCAVRARVRAQAARSPAGRPGMRRPRAMPPLRVASRPVRSDSATRPSVGCPAGRLGGRRHAVLDRHAARPRTRCSRASSSMTWSSPWPWMNCMA